MEQFFLPPPQPSQSGWESLQSILWMYLSWLIGIYTLEKLASGWGPSASPLLGRPHIVGRAGPAGGLWAPWGLFNWQMGQEETTSLIVVWRTVPLKDLSSNLWRAFSPKWVVACKELTSAFSRTLSRVLACALSLSLSFSVSLSPSPRTSPLPSLWVLDSPAIF